MVKNIGLTRASKKMIKFEKFSEDYPRHVFYAMQSLAFFKLFQNNFGDGCQTIIVKSDGQTFDVPNLENLSVNLVMFHFAIELLLKALLSLKIGKLTEEDEHHEIHKLLEKVAKQYEEAREIKENQEYFLILEELGINFDGIRYAEGSLFLRHNNKKGWPKKKPLQELAEALYVIYAKLFSIYEANK